MTMMFMMMTAAAAEAQHKIKARNHRDYGGDEASSARTAVGEDMQASANAFAVSESVRRTTAVNDERANVQVHDVGPTSTRT